MELTATTNAAAMLTPQQHAAIDRKAQEFEALILSELLKPMFETAKSTSLLGGEGPEQDAFSSMLHDEYGRALAERGGVGIADQVKDALIRLQSNPMTIKGTAS